jgi:hypothetical protein
MKSQKKLIIFANVIFGGPWFSIFTTFPTGCEKVVDSSPADYV